MSIKVAIATGNPDSNKVKILSNLFLSKTFKVKTYTVPTPSFTIKSWELDSFRFMKVIKMASKDLKRGDLLLYLKDNTCTQASARIIRKTLTYINYEVKDWDLIYLCKWLDRCDLYTRSPKEVKLLPNKTSWLTRSYSPNGHQAILFSSQGIRRIIGGKKLRNNNGEYISTNIDSLTRCIENGGLKAYAVSPNLFTFDTLQSNNISDLVKMTECRRPERNRSKDDHRSKFGIKPIIWFIIIITTVLLLLWVFYSLGVRPGNVEKNTDKKNITKTDEQKKDIAKIDK